MIRLQRTPALLPGAIVMIHFLSYPRPLYSALWIALALYDPCRSALLRYGTFRLKRNHDQFGSHCREVLFHIVAITETVQFLLVILRWYSLLLNEAGSVYSTETQLIVWCSYLTNRMCEGYVGSAQNNSAPALNLARMITRIPNLSTRLRWVTAF
jgi:hypothetical protein